MRWTVFFILAYLVLAVQIGLAGVADIHGARLNLVLLAAVFIALDAPRGPALLGCFMLGLFQDLLTIHPLGVWALAYGIVAMFVVSTQEAVYREHPLTHLGLGLGAALLAGAVIWLHGLVYPMVQPHEYWQRPALLPLFFSALYTAAAAPPVLWLLQRTRGLMDFRGAHLREMAHTP